MTRSLIPFALEQWFAEFEFVSGMHHLAASGAYAASTQEVLALDPSGEATQRYLALGLDYIDSLGNHSLREALIDLLYPGLAIDQVRITTGASEALVLLTWALTTPGDNIILEDPGYESVSGVAAALGVEVRRLPRLLEQGWLPAARDVQRLIDHQTRFVLLSYPHNPTGAVLAPDDLRAIAEVVHQAGARLISDEVFRPITLAGDPVPSALDLIPDAIVVGDMTKPWGLGGVRVGWVAARDRALLAQLKEIRDYTTMCSSGPGEFLAELVLRSSERILAPRLANARANLARLHDMVARQHLTWQEPTAGYSAFIRLPHGRDSYRVCRHLALDHQVLLVPGAVFGAAYAEYVRIGFGGDPQIFTESLQVIEAVFAKDEA